MASCGVASIRHLALAVILWGVSSNIDSMQVQAFKRKLAELGEKLGEKCKSIGHACLDAVVPDRFGGVLSKELPERFQAVEDLAERWRAAVNVPGEPATRRRRLNLDEQQQDAPPIFSAPVPSKLLELCNVPQDEQPSAAELAILQRSIPIYLGVLAQPTMLQDTQGQDMGTSDIEEGRIAVLKAIKVVFDSLPPGLEAEVHVSGYQLSQLLEAALDDTSSEALAEATKEAIAAMALKHSSYWRVLYADAGRALLALRALRLEFKGTGDMPTATTLRLQKLYILAGPAILLYPAEVAADVTATSMFNFLRELLLLAEGDSALMLSIGRLCTKVMQDNPLLQQEVVALLKENLHLVFKWWPADSLGEGLDLVMAAVPLDSLLAGAGFARWAKHPTDKANELLKRQMAELQEDSPPEAELLARIQKVLSVVQLLCEHYRKEVMSVMGSTLRQLKQIAGAVLQEQLDKLLASTGPSKADPAEAASPVSSGDTPAEAASPVLSGDSPADAPGTNEDAPGDSEIARSP